MQKYILIVLGLLSSLNVMASTLDCKNVYVGTISQRVGNPLIVVFKDAPGNSSGSYAQYFTGWTQDEKNTAVSLLLAARMSGHRVNIETTEASKCDIETGGRTLSFVQLANIP